MTVIDLARTDVVTVPPEQALADVAELMADQSVGSVIVVEDDRPVGLLTDRDLALAVVGRDDGGVDLTAGDVMSADLVTVDDDAGIFEALSTATEASVRRLPVVAADGRLAGIVTLDDFIVLLASEIGSVSDIVQAESPPY